MNTGAVYTTAALPYRDPSTAHELPTESNHGRASLPNRHGVGSRPQDARTKPHEVELLNGRKIELLEGPPSLDVQGYEKCMSKSVVQNFSDGDEVINTYFPEVERLVRRQLNLPEGAKVLIFDHALRTGGQKLKEEANGTARAPYARIVHCDTTVRSGHTRAKDQILGTNETVVKYGRLPAGWGDVRPGAEAVRRLFRSESSDHDSPGSPPLQKHDMNDQGLLHNFNCSH
jgi:hypothetical protein